MGTSPTMSCRYIASSALRRASRSRGTTLAPRNAAEKTVFNQSKRREVSSLSSSDAHRLRSAGKGRSYATQTVTVVEQTTQPKDSVPPPIPATQNTAQSRKEALSQARLLLSWNWFPESSSQTKELNKLISKASSGKGDIQTPKWLAETFALAKSYRRARSRLWRPSQEQLAKAVGSTGSVDAWIASQLKDQDVHGPQDLETRVDWLLKPVWEKLTPAEREAGLLRVKFECARRLGWRSGYSAGYPIESPELVASQLAETQSLLQETEDHMKRVEPPAEPESAAPQNEETAAYREALVARKEALLARQRGLERWATEARKRFELLQQMSADATTASADAANKALRALLEKEEEDAWKEWKSLSAPRRDEEFKAAWKLRDRSHIYLDSSPTSSILNAPMLRWYPTPQRAGQLQFLPNIIVKLVKNFTPVGQEYDPWKATFRVPLTMHKHMLRSYLLSIYGLRTTWARSSVYRSPIIRNPRTGRKEVGSGRTYKKVEVGLLEPFVWPDVDPKFKTERLMSEDMEFERQRMFIRMTKGRRWRAVRPVDPESPGSDKPALIMARAKGIPTARHSRILTLLRDQKIKKEALISEKANALAAETNSGSPAL